MIDVQLITSQETPREILEADFKALRSGFPICGGWGYSRADACIIDKNDPVVDQSIPFNGVALEYVFVEKRIYEELIIFRPKGDQFSGIQWNLLEQRLISDLGKCYDYLRFEVRCWHERDWDELKAEYEGPNGATSPTFDLEAHIAKRGQRECRFEREYWFDISSFHGS